MALSLRVVLNILAAILVALYIAFLLVGAFVLNDEIKDDWVKKLVVCIFCCTIVCHFVQIILAQQAAEGGTTIPWYICRARDAHGKVLIEIQGPNEKDLWDMMERCVRLYPSDGLVRPITMEEEKTHRTVPAASDDLVRPITMEKEKTHHTAPAASDDLGKPLLPIVAHTST